MANIDHYLHASLPDARASLIDLLHRDPGEAATAALEILLTIRKVDNLARRRQFAVAILSKAAIALGEEHLTPLDISLPSCVKEIQHPFCDDTSQ